MPFLKDISFSADTVGALLMALVALFLWGHGVLQELTQGASVGKEVKQEVRALRTEILAEHTKFTRDLAAFKELETSRHARDADRINGAETSAKLVQKDVNHIAKSVDLLHKKVDRLPTREHSHPFTP